ncbi:MAG: hypothetical protein IKH46_10960 [Lachnospiraceae bacterium]|nr:hypothetical protein [Lachnospiraceae bacterium]
MVKMKSGKGLKVLIVFAVMIIGAYSLLHYGMGLGFWKGKSFDTYQKRTVQAVNMLQALPENAQDFRFRCNSLGMGATSVVAFTLSGEDYENFISTFQGKYNAQEDPNGFVGKRVSETLDAHNEYGEYVGFPKSSFKQVIDDEIGDYTIVYYSEYRGAGARIKAIAYRQDTGRVVLYSHGNN